MHITYVDANINILIHLCIVCMEYRNRNIKIEIGHRNQTLTL